MTLSDLEGYFKYLETFLTPIPEKIQQTFLSLQRN